MLPLNPSNKSMMLLGLWAACTPTPTDRTVLQADNAGDDLIAMLTDARDRGGEVGTRHYALDSLTGVPCDCCPPKPVELPRGHYRRETPSDRRRRLRRETNRAAFAADPHGHNPPPKGWDRCWPLCEGCTPTACEDK